MIWLWILLSIGVFGFGMIQLAKYQQSERLHARGGRWTRSEADSGRPDAAYQSAWMSQMALNQDVAGAFPTPDSGGQSCGDAGSYPGGDSGGYCGGDSGGFSSAS